MLKKYMRGIEAALLAILVVFSFGAAGEICGSFFETTAASFGSKFPDNKPADITAALEKLGAPAAVAGPKNATGAPLAILVTDESPRALVAVDLEAGKELWKVTPPIQSELAVGDDIVVFQSGFKVVALDVRSGEPRWSYEIEEGWNYHGADIEGGLAVVTIGVGGEQAGAYANGRIIAFNAKNGSVKWESVSGGGLIGRPAIQGELVFVPWDRQKVVVLERGEGREICRLRADDFTINFVKADATGAYYGSLAAGTKLSSIYRLTEKSAAGSSAGSSGFSPALEPVPGEPAFERDAFALPVAGRSGTEKIMFHWGPAPDSSGAIAFEDGAFYLHYWRFIIGFDQATQRTRWTFRSDKDIESVEAVAGGVVGVDTNGRMFFVDATSGAELWSFDSGHKVLTAVFDADGFKPAGGGGAAPNPIDGLKQIVWDKDNRMLPIRSYAAFLMAAFPEPEVTQDLLTVYSDASSPKGLRDAVVQALGKRTTGAEYLVKALHMHYDFLEQTEAPPMGVVSHALINMGDRSGVSGLLEHLMDHETPIADLKEIAAAVRELGDASSVSTLTQFVTLYHADSSFLGHEDVVATATEAILKHGGAAGEKFVAQMRDDPQTLPELKSALFALLDPEAAAKAVQAAKAAEEAAKKAAEESAAEAAARAAAAEEANRPYFLTADQINETVAANQTVLKPCIQAALGINPSIRQVRLRFAIAGASGQASNLQVLPSDVPGLLECLTNGLATIAFPKFRSLRQPATYTIQIQGKPVPTAPDAFGAGSGSADPDSFGGGGAVPAPQYQYPVQPQPQMQPAPQPVPQPVPQPAPQPVPQPAPQKPKTGAPPAPQPAPFAPPAPPAPPPTAPNADPDSF